MNGVASIQIAAQYALERLANQLLDHFPCARVMVFVIAKRRGGNTPDVSVLSIFSPPRFIGLHGRAAPERGLEFSEHRLGIATRRCSSSAISPALTSPPCRVWNRTHICRTGKRITVRIVAIRLISRTPSRPCPNTWPWKSTGASCHISDSEHTTPGRCDDG